MTRAKPLGEFEIVVIAATLRLGEGAYGAAIRKDIQDRTDRKATVGAIYTTLSRLEKKGLVKSKLGEATAERGGRPKRFFQITAEGKAALSDSVAMLGNMLEGLPLWLIPTR